MRAGRIMDMRTGRPWNFVTDPETFNPRFYYYFYFLVSFSRLRIAIERWRFSV